MKSYDTNNTDNYSYYNQPETLTSLAAKYQVSLGTFRKWIKPIEYKLNIAHKKPFTPAELRIIIEFLGEYNV
ncbi:MAG: hypothetical protein JEZ03_16630 [Bacteroidales bacterium]|nr:hypothetical protein [Bacteroidales bacterium]